MPPAQGQPARGGHAPLSWGSMSGGGYGLGRGGLGSLTTSNLNDASDGEQHSADGDKRDGDREKPACDPEATGALREVLPICVQLDHHPLEHLGVRGIRRPPDRLRLVPPGQSLRADGGATTRRNDPDYESHQCGEDANQTGASTRESNPQQRPIRRWHDKPQHRDRDGNHHTTRAGQAHRAPEHTVHSRRLIGRDTPHRVGERRNGVRVGRRARRTGYQAPLSSGITSAGRASTIARVSRLTVTTRFSRSTM